MLDNGETAESPLLTNIEVLQVQVQNKNKTSTADNDVDNTDGKYKSNIDAGDMKSVEIYINDNSRADLTIEDVSRDSNITETADGKTGLSAVDKFESVSFKIGATTITANISTATNYDDVAGYAAGDLAGQYNPILITNNASGTLTAGTIAIANDTVNANMVNTMTNVVGSEIPSLTSTNVVFDRVGRDSQGGDFIAGSDSTGTSGSKGIQQFDISVDRSSWLTSVSSTNNTLEVLNIKNIKENSDGKGNLTIKKYDSADKTTTAGITDVRVIDASKMTGSADIKATLSANVVEKYLNLTDSQENPAADNSDNAFLSVVDTYFSYDFGSNNDKFDLTIDGSNLAAAGSATREDFVLEINAGAGDDTIITDITTFTAAGYINAKMNANLTINTDAGNDTVRTMGEGGWII